MSGGTSVWPGAFVRTTVIDRWRSLSTCGTDRKPLVTLGVDFKN